MEKFTRITVLLAEVTILFLPVNLMTQYFSTEIEELQRTYSAKAYWGSFGVVFAITSILLALFMLYQRFFGRPDQPPLLSKDLLRRFNRNNPGLNTKTRSGY